MEMDKTDHYLLVEMLLYRLLPLVEAVLDFTVEVVLQALVMPLVLMVQVAEDHHITDTHRLLQVQPKKALLKKVVERLFLVIKQEQMKQVLKDQVKVRQAKTVLY